MESSHLSSPIVTLLTDFGTTDAFVGVMKGVILGIASNARIVDLTHEVAPQNLLEAALKLESAIRYFPVGTIHVVVVDPGVGTERSAIVVQTENATFVAPDNGVLTFALETFPPIRVVALAERASRCFLQPTSATFHGRDIFAPIAAHLAAGMRLDLIAEPDAYDEPPDYVRMEAPTPTVLQVPNGGLAIRAEILYVDRFGNGVSNVTRGAWEAAIRETELTDIENAVTISVGGATWSGIARTFGAALFGAPVAYWGSSGRLEVGIRNGSLSEERGVVARSPLLITISGTS